MQAKDIPNLITIGRFILIVPVVLLLANRLFVESMFLFLVAGVSDALDGFLAKRFDWQSRLGSILDPLADKFLLIAAYLTCSYIQLIPWWVSAAVVVRDVVIILGAIYYYKRIQKMDMRPSIVSKINTFLQIILVLLIIIQQIYPLLPVHWLHSLFYIVFTTTCLSGADYIWTWGIKAWHYQH